MDGDLAGEIVNQGYQEEEQMKRKYVFKVPMVSFMFIYATMAVADIYGICEPPECGGGGSGGAEIVFFIVFIALAFGWIGGREWATIIYIPTLVGILPVFLLVLLFKGVWPWEYSMERFLAAAFIGYILGWIIIYLNMIRSAKNKNNKN